MASEALQNRIAQLVEKSGEAAARHEVPQALDALKEASHLDPDNARVQEALVALEKRERSGDAVALLQRYLGTGAAREGGQALQALRQQTLPREEAEHAFHLLLDSPHPAAPPGGLLDSLTAALFSRNPHVQLLVARKFHEPVTELFDLLYARGAESVNAFSDIPLNDALWEATDVQARAQRDLFRLCIAKLIDADIQHPERLMQLVARQLAVAPQNIDAVIDMDVFEVVLDCLDIRLDAALRRPAMVATSKLLASGREKGEQLFGRYLAAKVGKQTIDDFIVAFSSAAAVFPMMPAVAAQLFLTDGFVQQLVPSLERNFESGGQRKRKSATLELAALELLSAACVDKACRAAVHRYCSPWLRSLSDEPDGRHRALSSLVLAKINAESSEEVTSTLADLVLVNEATQDQAIEGLAYTTLQAKVKEDIAANAPLLGRLVRALTDRPTAAFGCLTIFSNLTAYRPPKTAEQKKMEQLKAYANQQKVAADDPLDNDGFVTARASKLLDADIVPALVASCKQTSSPTNIAMVVRTLLAIAREQKHRTKMVSQGAVKLLLQIRERIAKTDKSTADASSIDRHASHALARLLISVNPAHVFSAGSLPASTAVSSLIPLLTYDIDAEQRDLLPTFEALLALTNLASMEDPVARDLLLRPAAFGRLEDLLFSSNTLVQRASVELLCNLTASPSGVAKFADGSPDAKRRLHLLLALSDAEDLATRRAAAGALAMLTEWDSAVTAVLDHQRGMDLVMGMCEEDDGDGMQHRGLVCLLNIVSAPGPVGERGVRVVREGGWAEVIKAALRGTRDRDVLSLGVEVLKMLQS